LAGTSRSVNTTLSILLVNTELRYEQIGNTIVISPARQDAPSPPPATEPAKVDHLFRDVDEGPKSKPISGTVTNERGEPISGASITIHGTKTGTTTDAAGHFKLTVPDEGAALDFSSVGYQNQSITTGSQTVFNIVLVESVKGLNDVVVI